MGSALDVGQKVGGFGWFAHPHPRAMTPQVGIVEKLHWHIIPTVGELALYTSISSFKPQQVVGWDGVASGSIKRLIKTISG
jgi:hypothetical protein